MKLLLTNDDGYLADGLRILIERLKTDHQVYVCAPLKQMSATGHAISLFKPMEMVENGPNDFALDGTPADCVKVALFHLFKDIRFDMVVSGINDGPNMGDDVFYSGTVAAAREGAMNGIMSMACSMDGWNTPKDYQFPAVFVREFIHHLKMDIITKPIIFNINFPNLLKPKGFQITHLGQRVYQDFVSTETIGGRKFVTIGGDDPTFNDKPGSDLNAVDEGFVSVTPIANEIQDSKLIHELRYLEKLEWKSLLDLTLK